MPRPYIPPNNFSKGLNITVNHLLLRGAFTTRLVDNNEPVIVITAREKWSHFGGGTVTEVGTGGVERRVCAGLVDPAPNRGEPGGRTGNGLDSVRERS